MRPKEKKPPTIFLYSTKNQIQLMQRVLELQRDTHRVIQNALGILHVFGIFSLFVVN